MSMEKESAEPTGLSDVETSAVQSKSIVSKQNEITADPPETSTPKTPTLTTPQTQTPTQPKAEPTVPPGTEPTTNPTQSKPETPVQPTQPKTEPATQPPTEKSIEKPTEAPTQPFDIDYWIAFAKNYAVSIGLKLNAEAISCWDNPMIAGPKSVYLERDIKDSLGFYKSSGFTDIWIWAESRGDGTYDLIIGYA